MKQYLPLLLSVVPNLSEPDLSTPISETNIDSLDLVEIRIVLERHFNQEINDELWFKLNTLEQALHHFHSNSDSCVTPKRDKGEEIFYDDEVEIRMPQMANTALSESWLLKYLGDTHWQLLGVGFNKKSSEFQDSLGNRIYATFLRIRYELDPLNSFLENQTLSFKSKIAGLGKSSYLTEINGTTDRKRIESKILSTFTIKNNDNNLVSVEEVSQGRIMSLDNTPLFIGAHKLLRKNLLEDHCVGGWDFKIKEEPVYCCDYQINPYYDINGVGLLYFAAYPLISDTCFLKYLPEASSYHTIFRDIFYFSNCQMSESIEFRLLYYKDENGCVLTTTSLYKKSDLKRLATIFTVKKSINSSSI